MTETEQNVFPGWTFQRIVKGAVGTGYYDLLDNFKSVGDDYGIVGGGISGGFEST